MLTVALTRIFSEAILRPPIPECRLTRQHVFVPRNNLLIAYFCRLPALVNNHAIRVHNSICRHRRKRIWMYEREIGGEFAVHGTREMDAERVSIL